MPNRNTLSMYSNIDDAKDFSGGYAPTPQGNGKKQGNSKKPLNVFSSPQSGSPFGQFFKWGGANLLNRGGSLWGGEAMGGRPLPVAPATPATPSGLFPAPNAPAPAPSTVPTKGLFGASPSQSQAVGAGTNVSSETVYNTMLQSIAKRYTPHFYMDGKTLMYLHADGTRTRADQSKIGKVTVGLAPWNIK